MGVVGRAWARYRARKTRKGIALDFAFLGVVIVMAVAPLRRGVMTYALRCVITQPDAYEPIAYAAADSIEARTAQGADTVLHFPPSTPVALNAASPWSAQSRAEMRSLNRAAERWAGIRFYVIVEPDEAHDMERYMARRHYSALRMLSLRAEEDGLMETPDGQRRLSDELLNSVPATMVVDADGQVIVKKFGAARWTGDRIDQIFSRLMGE